MSAVAGAPIVVDAKKNSFTSGGVQVPRRTAFARVARVPRTRVVVNAASGPEVRRPSTFAQPRSILSGSLAGVEGGCVRRSWGCHAAKKQKCTPPPLPSPRVGRRRKKAKRGAVYPKSRPDGYSFCFLVNAVWCVCARGGRRGKKPCESCSALACSAARLPALCVIRFFGGVRAALLG